MTLQIIILSVLLGIVLFTGWKALVDLIRALRGE